MDLRKDSTENSFSGEHFEEATHSKGELFVARESFFEEDFDVENIDEENEEEAPSYGVYFQGKEKTLLGLFWDEELAKLFMNSVKNSKILEKVKEIA